MGTKSKLIISLIGIGAVVVPVVLLLTLTSGTVSEPEVSSEGSRQIDSENIEDTVRRLTPSPSPIPSPVDLPEESTSSPEITP